MSTARHTLHSLLKHNLGKNQLHVAMLCACTISDEVAEWLRRWTANPLCSARVGSNPILVAFFSPKMQKLLNEAVDSFNKDYPSFQCVTATRKIDFGFYHYRCDQIDDVVSVILFTVEEKGEMFLLPCCHRGGVVDIGHCSPSVLGCVAHYQTLITKSQH